MENTSSSELLVVGPGHLGARVATLWKTRFILLMSGSSHIGSILIGIKYQNCCRTLDVYRISSYSFHLYVLCQKVTEHKVKFKKE